MFVSINPMLAHRLSLLAGSFGALPSQTLLPVSRTFVSVSDGEHSNMRGKNSVHDDEWKLAENVSLADFEVRRPTVGCFLNSCYALVEFLLEIQRCGEATFPIPFQGS
jgi:hypothetical protein